MASDGAELKVDAVFDDHVGIGARTRSARAAILSNTIRILTFPVAIRRYLEILLRSALILGLHARVQSPQVAPMPVAVVSQSAGERRPRV
jgi:hypothetical protein